MKSWLKHIVATAVVLVLLAAYVVWNAMTAARTPDEVASREADLVQGRCTESEAIDRWLLQQSWFYDQAFTRLAGAFGQSSFSLYKNGDTTKPPLEGAFCINGSDLIVRYYERHFVPVMVRPSKLSVEFGTKLTPLGQDIYRVKELTKDRMVLNFESDGLEHVFYRKN